MTTMGKILVTVNLLFSLLTGALIIMVFLTRTNWSKGFDDVKRDLERERANYNNLVIVKAEGEAEKTKLVDDFKQKFEEADKDRKLKVTERDDAKDKMQEAIARLQVEQLAAQKATSVSEAMKVEIKSLDERLAESQKLIRELGLQNKDYKAETIKARTELQSALDRSKQLLEQLVDRDRKLAAVTGEQAAKAGRDAPNPPPDDVHGRVVATDDAAGWITINLGSDSGLSKGNTLEVYRLKPRPTYVGTLRVFDVRPNEAIGKLTGTGRAGKVQKDDEVASKILGQ